MSIISFETKNYMSTAFVWSRSPDTIIVRVQKKGAKKLDDYFLSMKHQTPLSKIKNHTALVAYAKANQITDSASNARNGSDSASVTSCPVPVPAPAKSSGQARDILFVEVETTGRGKDTEIIEISVVDSTETLLFHSLVKPSKRIKNPEYNGIDNADVINAPSFAEIWKLFTDVIGHSPIAFYNAEFSKRIMRQSIAKAFDTPTPEHFYTLLPYNKVLCVGKRYEQYNNNHLGFHRSYGLQWLNQACGQLGIVWRDVPDKGSTGKAIKSARVHNTLNSKELAL